MYHFYVKNSKIFWEGSTQGLQRVSHPGIIFRLLPCCVTVYKAMLTEIFKKFSYLFHFLFQCFIMKVFKSVVLNLFHCWDPLNATDVVWDPQSKLKKYALRNKV